MARDSPVCQATSGLCGVCVFPLARQRFLQAIQLPDEQIDLARVTLHIAQEEYPNLDVEEYLNALDMMGEEVRERLSNERYPLRILQGLNRYLYEDLGFVGNTSDYYDPRNSFLNDVIDQRTGIPITLSLVYMEVARRIDFPMVGVGMPGHFLIRPDRGDMDLHVDPFHRGELLFKEDCQARLSEVYGQSLEMQPAFLEPVSPRFFLMRILTNLKFTFLRRGELEKSVAAIDRILLIFPGIPPELRDRGMLSYQLGQWGTARADLEDYLAAAPQATDAALIQQLLERITNEE